jgi:uncharacterized membrane protein
MNSSKRKAKDRFWEVDCLRGIAITGMILFHFFFDLNYFNIYTLGPDWKFWWLFPRAIAGTFILLVGISLTLSYNRTKKQKTGKALYYKYLTRGMRIFSLGLLITLMTWIFLPKGTILFGVLHFIGISIILSFPLVEHPKLALLLSFAILLAGIYLQNFTFDFPWLLWLGFTPSDFYTFDYFPLLPWLGITLLGIFFGNLFYPEGTKRFRIKELSNFFLVKILCFLGRHSLIIYLIHQPIIIFLLYLLGAL